MNLSVNLSVNSSFQQILVIWTLFINLKTLNTIGRHVPNVLVFYSTDSFELNKFNKNQQFTQIPQLIHFDSSMNSLRFLNKLTQIPQ